MYTLKSPNIRLIHIFLPFVVSLQSRLYTLALIFVFDLDIYSSRLRLFKIYPLVSYLPATASTLSHVSAVFPAKLTSRYVCFKYLNSI